MEVVVTPDTSIPLSERGVGGHNRWHWDIPPVARCGAGDELVLTTWDGLDAQINSESTVKDAARVDPSRVHPLTGPVWVEDAEPGDLLAVEVLDIEVDSYGFTHQRPGLGLLDGSPLVRPNIVHWDIDGRVATSPQLPGARIRGNPFLGVMGVAPSAEMVAHHRKNELAREAGPREHVVPNLPRVVEEGLSTGPPREHGGNMDVRQLTVGSVLYLPVACEGALFSAGDAHFTQGDGEVCGAAVETKSKSRLRLNLVKAHERQDDQTDPFFDFHLGPGGGEEATGNFMATIAYTRCDTSSQDSDRLKRAAQEAIEKMISRLRIEYSLDPMSAYALCSVAADLRIAQIVSAPHFAITATLSREIFA